MIKLIDILNEIKLEEYSQKIINQLLDKFKKEDPNVPEDKILYYINRFDQIKDAFPNSHRDITKLSLDRLSQLVNAKDREKDKGSKINMTNVDLDVEQDLIFNEEGIKVYIGSSKEKCIVLGKGHRFCISDRWVKNNRFDRYDEDFIRIYFIFDNIIPNSDSRRLIVVTSYSDNTYGITDIDNDIPKKGVNVNIYWNKALTLMHPHTISVLKDKENLFKPFSIPERPDLLDHIDYKNMSHEERINFINLYKNNFNVLFKILEINYKNPYAPGEDKKSDTKTYSRLKLILGYLKNIKPDYLNYVNLDILNMLKWIVFDQNVPLIPKDELRDAYNFAYSEYRKNKR